MFFNKTLKTLFNPFELIEIISVNEFKKNKIEKIFMVTGAECILLKVLEVVLPHQILLEQHERHWPMFSNNHMTPLYINFQYTKYAVFFQERVVF